MSVEPYIVDAEIVDETENTDAATGLRGHAQRARTAVSRVDDRYRIRARSGAARSDVALVSDGVRGRRLRQYEHERMAEYRHNGNPDADVREDLRSHYEREKDRRERAAAADDGEVTLADVWRYSRIAGIAVGELLLLAWLFGSLSGWYAAVAVLVGIANIVALPIVWRRFRREGQSFRDKHRAWQLGQAVTGGDTDDDHSADSLTGVFVEAGIVRSKDAGGQGLTLVEPVSSDSRSFTARLVLPGGITVGKVRAKLPELASAFDVYPQQIQIGSGESERRLVLRVFRELPFTGSPVRSPMGSQARSLSAGAPIGADINGEPVTLDLAKGRHGLVVASSGNGKSVLVQNIASATVLDVAGTLTVLDGKPDGSYTQYKPLCYGYVTTSQDEHLLRAAELLESLCDRMDERLTRAENGNPPEGDDVIILDEFQEWTGNLSGSGMGKGEPKPRIRAALDRLARRGRSARMRLVLASQDYDGRQLDDPILTNIGWRAIGYAPSDMSKQALGDLAKRFGLDTSTMFVDEVQAGAAVVAGGGVHPYTAMRGYLQTPDDIRAIVTTAAHIRETTPSAAADVPADSEHQDATPVESSAATSTLDESAAALLRAVLEVYGDDDADWIPATTLVAEVAVGELGYSHDRTTEMAVSETLLAAGATKKRTTAAGENKPMSWHRATLIQAARTALGE